jgi:hypothetical protein
VVDLAVVSETLRTIHGDIRIFMLQRVRLWRLLDDGTSRLADQGLAEHCHTFRNIVLWITSSPATSPGMPVHLKPLQ